MTTVLNTEVAIIGGGPAGLMLAIELGCRGIECVVLDERDGGPIPPKANATSSRTMEHYRRRGFAHRVRAVGLTEDHPQDVVFRTRLALAAGHHELARLRMPSRREAFEQVSFGDLGEQAWSTPELPHRGQQMYIEPILREEAGRYPSVHVLLQHRATALVQDDDGVDVLTQRMPDSGAITVRASYAVGCDGARSLVRESMGVKLEGIGREDRHFFGGQMLSIYLRSREMYQVLGPQRAWLYWAVNPELRGSLVAVNGIDEFVLGVQLSPGQTPGEVDAAAVLRNVIGVDVNVQVLGRSPWLAGYTLVAQRMGDRRVFIAGDSAHLFTPASGMGYNTSVDDAVNLGWKLAATLHGWGGDRLLDSYEAERRPIAQRNTRFARLMADGLGGQPVPEDLEAAGVEGEAARQMLCAHFSKHVRREYDIPGIQLGLRYAGSPIVAAEAEPAPPDEPNVYRPSGYPGMRAPHIRAADGRSIFDYFGRDFTLLAFGEFARAEQREWEADVRRLGIPFEILRWDDPSARALYGADRVLIRPDHHIAWRGAAAARAEPVLRMAVARPVGA